LRILSISGLLGTILNNGGLVQAVSLPATEVDGCFRLQFRQGFISGALAAQTKAR
jgi:hypothetical protein